MQWNFWTRILETNPRRWRNDGGRRRCRASPRPQKLKRTTEKTPSRSGFCSSSWASFCIVCFCFSCTGRNLLTATRILSFSYSSSLSLLPEILTAAKYPLSSRLRFLRPQVLLLLLLLLHRKNPCPYQSNVLRESGVVCALDPSFNQHTQRTHRN